MKRTCIYFILLSIILSGCKEEINPTFKYSEEKNLFKCSISDMDLIKEAVYVFEDFVFKNYDFRLKQDLNIAYRNYLKNAEANFMPIAENFDEHAIAITQKLMKRESLWEGTKGDMHLRNDGELLSCLIDDMQNEDLKELFYAMANSNTLRANSVAPLITRYADLLPEDRALVSYMALDMFYAQVFQLDFSLPKAELAKQIKTINDSRINYDLNDNVKINPLDQ